LDNINYRESDGCLTISFLTILSIIGGYVIIRHFIDFCRRDFRGLLEFIFGVGVDIFIETDELDDFDNIDQNYVIRSLRKELCYHRILLILILLMTLFSFLFLLFFKNGNFHHHYKHFYNQGFIEKIRPIIKEEIDKSTYRYIIDNKVQSQNKIDTIIIKHSK
jgi:hypothetical protein